MEKAVDDEHRQKLDLIQARVKHFHQNKKPFRVYHGSTSSTRPTQFSPDSVVDVSSMTRIYAVDTEAKTVKAEANVPMDDLVRHTLKSGLIPKVVMEFKGITVGGGYSSFSGESSSFQHGLFHQTISEVEIVLGDGTVMTASRSLNSELLEGAAGTMGTLGVATLLTVELVDAKPYVDLELKPFSDPTAIPVAMRSAAKLDINFIDGNYFRKGAAVMMLGRMTDKPQAKVMKKMQVHWFSDHILTTIQKDMKPAIVSLRLEDYLFRYDHGAFWGGKMAFEHYHVPNNRITRRLVDPFLDSRTCYHAFHKTGLANEYLVQDFLMPQCSVVEFMQHVMQTLPHFQLWLLPGLTSNEMNITWRSTDRFTDVASEPIFCVGVYGKGSRDPKEFVKVNRDLERKAFELKGTKVLYARVYSDEKEFWETYNRERYDRLRKQYNAENLPDMYEKLSVDMSKFVKQRPIMGLVDTLVDKARGKKDYILKKDR